MGYYSLLCTLLYFHPDSAYTQSYLLYYHNCHNMSISGKKIGQIFYLQSPWSSYERMRIQYRTKAVQCSSAEQDVNISNAPLDSIATADRISAAIQTFPQG